MIVPMRHITILMSQRDTDKALVCLRQMGVLHVTHAGRAVSRKVSLLKEAAEKARRALKVSGCFTPEEEKSCAYDQTSSFISEVHALDGQKKEIIERVREITRLEQWFKEWGRVSADEVNDLASAGIFMTFYETGVRHLTEVLSSPQTYLISSKKRTARLVHIAFTRGEKLAHAREISVPQKCYEEYLNEKRTLEVKLEKIEARLTELASFRRCFAQYQDYLEKKQEFFRVKAAMGADNEIAYVQGFIPLDAERPLVRVAEEKGWGVLIEKPRPGQNPPTLLRNPRWVQIIKPVFTFMGTLPGYKEFDISAWFLLFFSVFFAMIIGDAGYGSIFLFGTFFAHRKWGSSKTRQGFFLMYTLSVVTIIWGALSGTWFGFEKIAHIPFFNALIVERLFSFADRNQTFIMYVSFLIGAIQLTVAHSIIAWRFINSVKSIAQIGWMGIIWSVFFVAGNLVLGKTLPGWLGFLFAAAVVSVLLFSRPQKNIIKGVFQSLADLPLQTISSFSDVISYLRLFAVGYATVAVAATFNAMALNMGMNTILKGFVSAGILVLGHTLNIILGIMSVVVHGIRLNMLEFSSHLGMEWSGAPYAPFKE